MQPTMHSLVVQMLSIPLNYISRVQGSTIKFMAVVFFPCPHFAPATLSIKQKNTVHHTTSELSSIPGSKGEQISQ